MSTTVDERVVEMRFDNKHFESNVSTSMSTLDKLKQKLKLDGASKGLEEIDAASKKIDMSSLGSAVGSVGAKFSALQVVAVTALANITNSAVNAGKQLIKSLSVDQLSAGWQKFSDKTTSVATLVAQGNAIEDVNDQLDRLNWFTDETSYNFTEMVSNIAKFTATGKGLNESVTAMEGIATWAALSGQNAATASRAMYQLSQAMGAGVMRLEDYKSIQNASMDTEEFRKKCIEAGIALGTLKDNGDGTYTSLVEGASGTSWSISQFANNLTKEMWLTSDVMMSVFNTYSSAVDGIYNAAEEKGMLASEIIDEIYATAEEKSISTDEAIQLLGYDFDSFALKAFEAAQKARTFNDAIESVKDAVSTGWMKTFELIFGDAEKATELWTDLANTLWDVFAAGGEVRNTILEFALNFTKPWTTIYEKLQGVNKTFSKVTDTVKTATDKLEYFQDIVNKVWRGDYGNRGDNPDRFDLLTAAGYDSRVVQELVNKGYQYELTMDDVQAAHKKFGLTMETTTEETENVVEATNEATVAYTKLTDAQLEQAGLTGDEISLYRAMEKEAERLGISVEELADEMSTNDGRTLLIDSFKNAGNGLLGVLQAIKEAWKEIFGDPSVGEQAVKLYSLIKAINEFSKKLRLTDEETGKLNETGEKLKRTFKGVFAIVDIITTILGGAFKIVVKVIAGVLDALGISILDVTASLGDLLVAFRDWLLEDNVFAQAITSLIDNLISKIPVVIEKFKEWFGVLSDWFNAFKETPGVQKFVDAIVAIGEAFKKLFSGEISIAEFASELGKNLGNALSSIPTMAIQIGKDFIAGFGEGIGDGIGGIIKTAVNFCLNFVSSFASALGVASPSWKAAEIASDFFQGFINGAKSAVRTVISVLKQIGEGIVKVFRSLWDYITDENGNLEWGKIFAAASIVALILVLKKFTDVISGFAGILDSFGDLIDYASMVMKNFGKVLNSIAWDIKAEALKKMAIAIGILAASIWVLTTIDDVGKLWNAVAIIAVLAVILIALSAAMDKLSDASVKWDKGPQIEGIKSGLLQIGIAILLVAAAVKMIANMDADKAEQGFKGVIGIAIGMVAFLAAMGGISRYSGSVDGVGKMMTELAVAMLLMVIVCKLAGNLSAEEMGKGLLFIGALGGFIVGVTVMAKGAEKDIKYVGSMFIKLAIAMALMVIVCKLAAKLNAEQMLKGALFAGAFAIFVRAIVKATTITSDQQIAKVGGLLLSISVSMMLMVAVCKLVGKLSYDDMLKGAVFAAGFIIMMKAIVSVLKIGNEQKMAQVAASIIAMSAGIAVLAGICVLLSFLDEKSLAKGVTAVSVLFAMMALMVRGLKGVEEVKGTMMWMTLAIVAMAAAVVALSFIDTKSLVTSAASMAVMMGMFVLMIKSMSGLKKGEVAISAIAVLTGVLLVMGGLIFLLQDVKPENAIGNALALSALMLAMTGVLKILTAKMIKPKKALKSATALSTLVIPLLLFAGILAVTQCIDPSIKTVATLVLLMGAMAALMEFLVLMKPNINKAFKGAIALTTMAIPLLAFAVVLGAMSVFAVENAIQNAIALTILAGACSEMLVVLAFVGKMGLGNAMKGVVALSAMAVPLLLFVGILAIMSGVDNAMANIKALVLLVTALELLLVPLTVIGAFIYPALIGVIALTAMAVPMLAFIGVIALMNKVENATENLNLLIGMMTTMTGLLAQLALIGPMALIGVTAMTGLAGLIAVIGVVAVAIGALMQKFPSIQDFLDAGLPVLEQLAGSIGVMIGNFVSGLAGGIAEAMVKIANSLVDFVSTISIASLIAKTIKPGSFDGVEDLILVLIEIAGASVVTSIGDMFTNLFSGQTTMEKFVTDATTFMDGMKTICKATNGIQINQEAFDAVISAATALAQLQSSLEPMHGVVQWFMGEKNLGTFGESVSDFIRSMKVAFKTLDGMKLDFLAFAHIMSAAKALADLQSSLEPIGGVITWFAGRSDLATFGENVADFIESMKEAFWTLDGMTLNLIGFYQVIYATRALAELQDVIQPIGGVVTWFTGRSDLGAFGENMVDFFTSMKKAFEILAGATVDTAAIESMVYATTALAPLAESVQPIGGVVQWFTGRSDLGSFGEGIVSFAEGMKKLGECGVINSEAIDSMIPAAQKLSEFRGTLDTTGGVAAWFAGEIDFEGFGNGIYAFAKGMQAVSEVGSIDETTLQNLVDCGTKLTELEDSLSYHGGIFDAMFGDQDIGKFGEGILSFANGMKSVSEVGPIDTKSFENITTAAGELSKLEGSLTGTEGFIGWITGRQDLATFGEHLEAFMSSMKNAFFSMEGMKYDPAMFANINDASTQLAKLESSLSAVDGFVGWITGRQDLETFGEHLASFMSSMKSAFVAMDGLKYDKTAFESVTGAAKELATLEGTLTATEGVIGWFTGRQDLGTFGEHIVLFAKGMQKLGECEALDETAITSIVDAAKSLSRIEKNLAPSFGGFIGFFTGLSTQDLGTFGTNIGIFADGMIKLAECPGFEKDVLGTITGAAESLQELEGKLEGSIGGVVSWWNGQKQNLGTFGEYVGIFADGFQKLANCRGVDAATLDAIINAAGKLQELEGKLEGSVGGIVSWWNGQDQNLGTFGESIGLFADGMQKLANCQGLDQAVIDSIILSAQKLSDLQSNLKTHVGGLIGWLTDNEDLGTFGEKIQPFADGMLALANCQGLDPLVIDSIILASQKLSTLQSTLTSNVGCLIAWFQGRDDLGTFGEKIGLFADAMSKLKTGMGEEGITEAVITSITNAGTAINELQKALPDDGIFSTKMDLEDFSEYVTDFAEAMSTFGAKAAELNPDAVDLAVQTANRIKNLIASLASLDTSGVATFTGIGTGGIGADGVAYNIAEAMTAFSDEVANINSEAISTSVKEAKHIRDLINSLAGLDTSGIENFKPQTIGTELKNYADKVVGINTTVVASSITSAGRLKELIASLVGLTVSGVRPFSVNVPLIGIALKEYSQNISNYNTTAISSSVTSACKLRDFIASLAGVNTSGVGSFKAAVHELGSVEINTLVKAFSDASSKLSSAGSEMFDGLIKGMQSKTAAVKRAVNTAITSVVDVITDRESSFSKAGSSIIGKLAKGISGSKAGLTTAMASCLSNVVSAIRNRYDAFYSAGSYLVTGFKNGISENSYKAAAKAKAMAEAAVEEARKALKINSPSKVFKTIGSGIPEGFAMGIGMLGGRVKRSVSDMASTAITSTRSAMTTVLDALNNDMDAQPTIRPVIDLTDVRSGANTINGMFAGTHAVGVQSNLNAISLAMNRKLQNGTNDDIISAINDLNDSLEGTRGDTYTIGGITYSNGDEVAEAVQTIVRAALIGRRV